jgi:hypothetical protein
VVCATAPLLALTDDEWLILGAVSRPQTSIEQARMVLARLREKWELLRPTRRCARPKLTAAIAITRRRSGL